MYPRTEYEMTEQDLKELLDACKSVPAMMIGGYAPASPQENANNAWVVLGKKMGFDAMTVQPVNGKGNRFFTAVPKETESQRGERLSREAAESREKECAQLKREIEERQKRLAGLGVE